jgi:hypothetical protein
MLRRFAPVFVFALLLGASNTVYADISSWPPGDELEPPSDPSDPPSEAEDKGEKAGSCSAPTLPLAALATLVLLISGMSLRQRARVA